MDEGTTFKDVGIIYNARVDRALPLAKIISAWMKARGISSWLCSREDYATMYQSADLLLILGGDGSILRAMQQAAPAETPLFGINLGRVGFLTEATPENWEPVLNQVLMDKGTVEKRTMLQVKLLRNGQVITSSHALNDAVVSRGALARTVRLKTFIDGSALTRYVTDALILSTATGSTAYAYAVGGPILPPWLDNILVVPAAPHLSLERPLVLNATAVVEVEVHTEMAGMLTVDGQFKGDLHNNDIVRVERSPLQARFLRLRSRNDFYSSLVQRLTPRNGD